MAQRDAHDSHDSRGSHGAEPPVPGYTQRPPHRPRHRVLVLVIVVLLIAIPAGYLVRSAFQSRDSGEEKQREAALANLTWEWPSKVQRRVYDVRIPQGSSYIAHYEDNAWKSSSLYAQFRTDGKKLNKFLKSAGLSRSELKEGKTPISTRQAAKVGWDFSDSNRDYAGVARPRRGEDPDLSIVVDMTHKERPRVFVVSTIDP